MCENKLKINVKNTGQMPQKCLLYICEAMMREKEELKISIADLEHQLKTSTRMTPRIRTGFHRNLVKAKARLKELIKREAK